MKKICGLAFGLVLASGGLAGAQVVTEVQTTTTPIGANTEIRRVSQLLGATVQLQGVNNFGRVEDAVIDDNGTIAYLVVSSNGQNVMLPWSEANLNLGQRIIVYNIAPQAVQPLFFAPGAWPNVWGPQYMTRVRQVFPRAGVIRREVLRPAAPAGAPVPPPGGVIDEKVKVKPSGKVKAKERGQ
jgi:hypothetical protein